VADAVTLNRDVFAKNPLEATIPNNGVATVADLRPTDDVETLRYELRTFVCEGEYARGLQTILDTYLRNVGNPEQPAVWVSGFYGSGKSHLVKVLRYLWTDYHFPDGTSARDLATLPTEIRDALKELSISGRQAGGLQAMAGTLGAGAGNIRLTLLSLLFRSVGLPAEYFAAQCVLWLTSIHAYDAVKGAVEAAGRDVHAELRRMYMSPVLAQAILAAQPSLAPDEAGVHALLRTQFPNVTDISISDTLDTISEVLAVNDKMPCTLLVLDEVQQYIGDNAERSYAVQEITEACSKKFAGRVLFVATGQSALYGTPLLQRLKDRYTVTVELSDTDVEAVTRQIVLLKAPTRLSELEGVLATSSGEIRRQLSETKIRPSAADDQILAADYPILPVRRRFWERVLRAVDRAGTAGQLRTQLRIVFEAVRAVAERPLGTVVPADFVYNELSSNMLQSGVLLREVHEIVGRQRDGTADGELRARLCALIFLIGKLPREGVADTGIRATPDMLADLLVEDLLAGGASLRGRLPALLDGLVEASALIKVEDEYRVQTREGATWTSDFQDRLTKIRNDESAVGVQRAERLRLASAERLKDINKLLLQGESKTPRKIELFFGPTPPPATGVAIPVWIRDGWSDSERDVIADAQKAGPESSTVFVFLPRRPGEEFKNALAGHKAATETLTLRGVPTSPEGQEARGAIETRQQEYERALTLAVDDILAGARVFQGGGNDVGLGLRDGALSAAQAALIRRYPRFDDGDSAKWDKVAEHARKGDKSPLAVLGYQGEIDKHLVCAAVLSYIGSGKKGGEIRKQFAAPPYGWPQDTVDGALLALFVGGVVRASHNGTALEVNNLTATMINNADFKAETVVIGIGQRLGVRKLLQENSVPFTQNQEGAALPLLLERLRTMAGRAGGPPPIPVTPDTSYLEEIGRDSGNAQVLAVYTARERIATDAQAWQARADTIQQRQPRWQRLQRLLAHAHSLPDVGDVEAQANAIVHERRLLTDPDSVPALCATLTEMVRRALTSARDAYDHSYQQQLADLQVISAWSKLTEEQRQQVLKESNIAPMPAVKVATEEDVLASCDAMPLQEWRNRTDALTQRFANARLAAQKLVEPDAVMITLPRGSFTTAEQARLWISELDDIGRQIMQHVEGGTPVVVQ